MRSSMRHIRIRSSGGDLPRDGAPARRRRLTWEQVEDQVPGRQPDAARRADRYSGVQGPGDHGLFASESEFHVPAWIRSTPSPATPTARSRYALAAGRLRLSARAAAQARTAPGERAERAPPSRSRSRRTWSGTCCSTCAARSCRRCRPKPVLAHAKENLEYFDRELAINRDRLQSRRHRAGGSGPPGVAARAVRIGFRDGAGESAHRQDHAADAVERPHAGGQVRRDRAVRVLGPDRAARRVSRHRAGSAAGPAGGRRGRRQGADRPQTGGGQRLDGSHLRRGLRAQSAHPASISGSA